MKKPCGNSHPIYNPGSVQSGRLPHALSTKNTEYDQRTVTDWLVYLNKYAKHVNFFSLNDEEIASGTWQNFFSQDVSMLLAQIAEEQISEIQSAIHAEMHFLQHETVGEQEARERFTLLFSHVFNLVARLDGYYKNIPGKLEFRQKLANHVFSKMEIRLSRCIAYYKAAKAASLFEFNPTTPFPKTHVSIEHIASWETTQLWLQQSGHSSWPDYFASIAADNKPFLKITNPPANDAAKINLAVRYQLLSESIKGIVSAFASIVSDANKQFKETMGSWPSHQPDKALLLSFLRLLELYRKELNTFTGKHLDYYYKEVLRLNNKKAIPDYTFLVLELAKNQNEYVLEKGAQFLGGKDEEGSERVYSTDQDVVINKAKVAANKAILKSGNKVYAAHNIATIDGVEKELEFPENGYSAFGTSAMQEAELGFSVASKHLFLREGERTIKLHLTCRQSFNSTMVTLIKNRAMVRVTGEKGWINLENVIFGLDPYTTTLTVSGKVPPEENAIVAIDKKVHERTFYPDLPVAEVLFKPQDYNYLAQFEVNHVSVEVIANGCQQIDAFANGSKVDIAKPFTPFGGLPKEGNALVLDTQEMLTKNIRALSIVADWQVDDTAQRRVSTITSSISKLNFQQLSGNSWNALSVNRSNSGNKATYVVSSYTKQKINTPEPYGRNSTKGFIRILLNDDLGHSGYPKEVSNHIIALNSDSPPSNTNIPNPYYTPALKSVQINYTAKSAELNLAQSQNYKADEEVFFHITPFGGYEASGNMLNEPYPTILPSIKNEGEYFIGLSDFKKGQSVKILISIIEGSANPLKAKQQVSWQYLENNRWVNFAFGLLKDGTNGLLQTGIVEAALPFDFDDQGTFFTDDLTYIKATIAQHTDAVCLINGAFAQGVKATLISEGHSTTHYQNALEAGSISKLKPTVAAVKKITQPVSAFGGKPLEDDNKYYQRVSERLRHKNRGISIWDYERLILEEFTQLAKVKTLSHTRYEVNEITNQIRYSEAAPGHVSIVCVPQKQKQVGNFDVPYTPINTLENIAKFISILKPDWANIHVRNPIFEFVQVDFRVQFYPEIIDTEFYKLELQTALKAFLSPWQNQQNQEFKFDWRIHKSAVIDFLDEHPTVDYVRDVKLNVLYNLEDEETELNVEEARPRYAVSVLISAENHIINLV